MPPSTDRQTGRQMPPSRQAGRQTTGRKGTPAPQADHATSAAPQAACCGPPNEAPSTPLVDRAPLLPLRDHTNLSVVDPANLPSELSTARRKLQAFRRFRPDASCKPAGPSALEVSRSH
eukprot:scaffold12532_cov48-Phaeocystis_antarctica.AAC.4